MRRAATTSSSAMVSAGKGAVARLAVAAPLPVMPMAINISRLPVTSSQTGAVPPRARSARGACATQQDVGGHPGGGP